MSGLSSTMFPVSARCLKADIENIGTGISSDFSQFVKGIIKVSGEDAEKKRKDLIIWLDMEKVLADLADRSKAGPAAPGIVHEAD